MATKPAVFYSWDTNNTNKVLPTSGHQLNGFATNEVPTSGEANGIYQYLCAAILWLYLNCATMIQNGFPQYMGFTGGTSAMTLPTLAAALYTATGATSNTANFDLQVPQGYKPTSMSLAISASAAGNPNMVVALYKSVYSTGVSSVLHTRTFLSGSLPTTLTDQVINWNASGALSAQTVTVNAAGGTFTRSAGSYLTDGFFIGQTVVWSGFVNGGNNATKIITALTATVMTVSTTGLVNETGGVGAAAVSSSLPTVDDTFGYWMQFQSTPGAGITNNFGTPRITMVPQ